VAEATVPRTRPQEPVSRAKVKPSRAVLPGDLRLRPNLLFIWIACLLGIGAFVGFGAVRIGAGHWIYSRLAVREIWSRFPGYLTNQGMSQNFISLIAAALVLAVLGAALLLWLALALRDEPPDTRDDTAAMGE
jgi:hypothetical protein